MVTCNECRLFAPSKRTKGVGYCSAYDQTVLANDIGSDFCEVMADAVNEGIQATIPSDPVVEHRENISLHLAKSKSHALYIPMGYYLGYSIALQLVGAEYKVNILRACDFTNLISDRTFLENETEEAWLWAKAEINKEIDGVLPY